MTSRQTRMPRHLYLEQSFVLRSLSRDLVEYRSRNVSTGLRTTNLNGFVWVATQLPGCRIRPKPCWVLAPEPIPRTGLLLVRSWTVLRQLLPLLYENHRFHRATKAMNPFSLKLGISILSTDCHTFLIIPVVRIWWLIKTISPCWLFSLLSATDWLRNVVLLQREIKYWSLTCDSSLKSPVNSNVFPYPE